MTSNLWGFPIFLGIMAIVFFLTFTLGDFFVITSYSIHYTKLYDDRDPESDS